MSPVDSGRDPAIRRIKAKNGFQVHIYLGLIATPRKR